MGAEKLTRPAASVGAILAVVLSSAIFASTAAATSSTAVTAAALTRTSADAGATDVSWRVGFVATHALTSGSSAITLTAPSATKFPATACSVYVFTDLSTGASSNCVSGISGAGTDSITIKAPVAVKAGDQVFITIHGIINPAAAAGGTLALSTSSDPTVVSLSAPTSAATAVSGIALTRTSPDAGASEVSWRLGFVAGHGLTANFSQLKLTAPAGTKFPAAACFVYVVTDLNTGATDNCHAGISGAGTNAITLTVPITAGQGDQLLVTINDVTNGSSSSPLTIASSSDPTSVTVPYPSGGTGAVKGATLTRTSSSAGAAEVSYYAGFVATSGLTAPSSTIVLQAPSGTKFPANTNCAYQITDLNTGADVEGCAVTLTGAGTNRVTIADGSNGNGGVNASPGDQVLVTVNGITNPTTAASGTLSLSTSSDPTAASLTDTTTAQTGVQSPALTLSSSTAGATANYLLRFTVKGGLTDGFSTIKLVAPSDTKFPTTGSCAYLITDLTTTQSACSAVVTGTGGSTVTMDDGSPGNGGVAVSPGDQVLVTVTGATNTTTKGALSLGAGTSSDPEQVSAAYSIN